MAVAADSKSLFGEAGDVWQLIVAYAKQETIGEIKPLGRFAIWGAAGSVFLSIGLVLLTLAGLRALQTETGTAFTGHLSWAPYLVTLVGCGIVAGLAARAIGKRPKESA